jgi:ribonuclease HI
VNELLTGELEWSMDLVNSTTSPESINDDRKRAMDDPDEHHQGGPIQAYTDGSFIDGKSGWAVIFGDTHFDEIYSSLPDEKHLRYEEFKNVRHMSGSNDPKFSVGIYDAELQAILRALMAVPVHRHVTIHTDNQAAISAITSPPMEARQLLRRSGRQWLSLITQTISERTRAMGHTDIVYVPAHTNSKTKQCVGNRCADVLAKRAATTRVHASTIPIETGDPYATVRDKRGHEGNDKGMVITTDIRRAALKRLYGNMRKQWISSNTQSAYSHECIGGSELWQWASIHGGSYTGFVMRAITNVLHWKNCAYTHDCIHRKGSKEAKEPASIAHMIKCDKYQKTRTDMAKAVIAIVHRYCQDDNYKRKYPTEWKKRVERNTGWDIRNLLRHWKVVHEERHTHRDVWLEAAMVGAFQRTNIHTAMYGSDVQKEEVDKMVIELRYALVKGMHSIWKDICEKDLV